MNRVIKLVKKAAGRSEVQSLSEQLSSNLPLSVKVVSCHPSLLKYFMVGSILHFYSVKPVKIAVLKNAEGQCYILPFNSNVHLSPFYNPRNDIEQAFKGYTFDKIDQLYYANPRPFAVQVIRHYSESDESSLSMKANDVFVLKKCTTLNKRKVIVCENVVDNCIDLFPINMTCQMTTTPSNLVLKASMLLHHIKPPVEVVLTLNASDSEKHVMKIVDISLVDCFVVGVRTSLQQLNGNDEQQTFYEIYADVDMRIEIVNLTVTDINTLKVNAGKFSQNCSYEKIINEKRYTLDHLQSSLLDCHSKDHDFSILHQSAKSTPIKCTNNVGTKQRSLSLPIELAESDEYCRPKLLHPAEGQPHKIDEEYYIVPCSSQSYHSPSLQQHQPAEYEKLKSKDDYLLPPSPVNNSQPHLPLSCDTANYTSVPEWSKHDTVEVTSQLKQPLKAEQEESKVTSSTTNDTPYLEENKRILKDLSSDEVTKILDKLGLAKEKEKFLSEEIDGALFMEMDEEILSKELGVHRKLDRLKLLLIIWGKRSVKEYL